MLVLPPKLRRLSPQARSDASRKKKGPGVPVTTVCPLWLEGGRIPHGFRSLSRSTTLTAESEEELKSFLMKVKEASKKLA